MFEYGVMPPLMFGGLIVFLLVGFPWGSPAGMFRALDEFPPGRHTYACFTAACIASARPLRSAAM